MAHLSKVTQRYILDFLFRLAVFLFTGCVYYFHSGWLDFTQGLSLPLILLWATMLVSMLSQLNANSGLTTGCLKQYPNHFDPVPDYDSQKLLQTVRQQNRGAIKVAVVWLAVNSCLGILFHRRVINTSILVLLCALAYLGDLVCVLFFCPFQTFLMHNRCCVNCRMTMKTDYITTDTPLPPHLIYPRFLLGVNVRFTAKEVYAIMLNMTLNSENVQTDKHGRRYLAFFNKTIAEIIDRTPATVAQALRELENVGLIEKKLVALRTPYRIYIKLSIAEDVP